MIKRILSGAFPLALAGILAGGAGAADTLHAGISECIGLALSAKPADGSETERDSGHLPLGSALESPGEVSKAGEGQSGHASSKAGARESCVHAAGGASPPAPAQPPGIHVSQIKADGEISTALPPGYGMADGSGAGPVALADETITPTTEGPVTLEAGTNNVTMSGVGEWSGSLQGPAASEPGAEATINNIAIASGFVAKGNWNLSAGRSVITGSGAVGGIVTLGAQGNDVIGNFAPGAPASDNGIVFSNIVNLGGGNNMLKAAGAAGVLAGAGNDTIELSGDATGDISLGDGENSVTVGGGWAGSGGAAASYSGGAGSDSVFLRAGESTNLDMYPEGGSNSLYISGKSGGAGSSKIGVRLFTNSQGEEAGVIYLCNEGVDSGACSEDASNQDYAYDAEIKVTKPDTTLLRIGNQPSDIQSSLTIRSDKAAFPTSVLKLENPTFENLEIKGDGTVGDILTISGTYGIIDYDEEEAKGTIFTLDVNTLSGKSDILRFDEKAKGKEGESYSKTPYVKLIAAKTDQLPASGTRIDFVDIARPRPEEEDGDFGVPDLEDVRVHGLRYEPNSNNGKVTLNNHDWHLISDVSEDDKIILFLYYHDGSRNDPVTIETKPRTNRQNHTLAAGINTVTVAAGRWRGNLLVEPETLESAIRLESGAIATGFWNLYRGTSAITGEGELQGNLQLGFGNDTIGNFAEGAPEADNSLRFKGIILFRGGNNRMRAKSGHWIISRAGDDEIVLEEGANYIDLGDGDNRLEMGESRSIDAGSGDDEVIVRGESSGGIVLGDGNNTLTVEGRIIGGLGDTRTTEEFKFIPGPGRTVSAGSGNDVIDLRKGVVGSVDLGGGNNTLTVGGDIQRSQGVAAVIMGWGDDMATLGGSVKGAITMGGGKNTLVAMGEVAGDVTSSGEGLGEQGDTFTLAGVRGDIDMGSGANSLTVRGGWTGAYVEPYCIGGYYFQGACPVEGSVLVEGHYPGASYTGGSGPDTVRLRAGESINLSTVSPGGGENRLYVLGKRGGPGASTITLSLLEAAGDSDSLYLCNEAESTAAGGGCGADAENSDYAYSVVLNLDPADSTKASAWETIKIGNEGSGAQSVLQVNGSLALDDPEFNNLLLKSDGRAGSSLTIGGVYEILDSPDGASGTVFELDVFEVTKAQNSGGQDQFDWTTHDTLVFDSTARSAAGAGFVQVPAIRINAVPHSGIPAAPAASAKLEIVTASQNSGITGLRILGSLDGRISLGGQIWSLGSTTESNGPTTYHLENTDVGTVTISAPGSGSQTLQAGAKRVVISGSGEWSGSLAGPATGNPANFISVASGVRASGGWTLGQGASAIVGSGEISGRVTLGGGDDLIGDFNPSAPSASNGLVFTNELILGDGFNRMKAARAAGITGGSGSDRIELLAITGGDGDIDLKGGSNSLALFASSAATWSGDYGSCSGALASTCAGLGSDTILLGEGVTASGALRLGAGDNTLKGSGAVSGSVVFGAGDDTVGNFMAGAPATDNRLDIRASMDLGEGVNRVRASSAQDIAAGSGHDVVELAGLRAGSWIFNLGDGSNALSLDAPAPVEWSGGYGNCQSAAGAVTCGGGGSIDDTVTIGANVTASGRLHFGTGNNTLKGSGAVTGHIVFGANDDTIGNFAPGAPGSDNLLRIRASAALEMGGGFNRIKAASARSVNGGAGRDIIEISDLEGGGWIFNLKGGTNSLSIDAASPVTWSGGYGNCSGSSVTCSGGGAGADTVTIGSNVTASGALHLGEGKNTLKGSGVITGAISLGDGDDTIGGFAPSENYLAIRAPLDLGDGFNEVTAREIQSVTGGPKRDIVRVTALKSGAWDFDLKGGHNTLSLRDNPWENYDHARGPVPQVVWSGNYGSCTGAPGSETCVGGDGIDELHLHSNIVASGTLHFGDGNNSLFGEGTISGKAIFGDGDDVVGLTDTGPEVTGSLDLGNGDNLVTAVSINSITAGDGDDRVIIRPKAAHAFKTFNLGKGLNQFWVLGREGDPSERHVTVDLTQGLQEGGNLDVLYICSAEASLYSYGCSVDGSRNFNVTLDMGGENDLVWSYAGFATGPTPEQSTLEIKTVIEGHPGIRFGLFTGFGNMRFSMSPGTIGERVIVASSYFILDPETTGENWGLGGALFELDAQVQPPGAQNPPSAANNWGVSSDWLVFEPDAEPLNFANNPSSPTPVIMIRLDTGWTPNANAKMRLLTVLKDEGEEEEEEKDPGIDGMKILGGFANVNHAIKLYNTWWSAGSEDALSVTTGKVLGKHYYMAPVQHVSTHVGGEAEISATEELQVVDLGHPNISGVNWTGSFARNDALTGKSGGTIITLVNGTKVAGGGWDLSQGNTVLKGTGEIASSVSVKMGPGDDVIGNFECGFNRNSNGVYQFRDSKTNKLICVDPVSDNRLVLSGAVDLGDGENWVRAISAAGLKGGSGSDTVELARPAGSASINLGDGRNTLVLGAEAESTDTRLSWSGGYGTCSGSGATLSCPSGGAHEDEITIGVNVTASGPLNLGDSDSLIPDDGGDPPDFPSDSPICPVAENSLKVYGSLMGSVEGGAGCDLVVFESRHPSAPSSVNLGAGRNRIFIFGQYLKPKDSDSNPDRTAASLALVNLPLSDGPASGADDDWILICNEGAFDQGCEKNFDSHENWYAYNVALDASGGNRWENVVIHNSESERQSAITVKGSVELRSARLHNVNISGDRSTFDDVITVGGEYLMDEPDSDGLGGTVFSLDLKTRQALMADKVVFSSSATPHASSATVAEIRATARDYTSSTAVAAGMVTVLEAHEDSGITGVNAKVLDRNGDEIPNWRVRSSSANSVTTFQLEYLSQVNLPVSFSVSGSLSRDVSLTAGVTFVTVDGTGVWSGSITGFGGASESVITISSGVTVRATWSGFNDEGVVVIKGSGTIESDIELGRGSDTIGNFSEGLGSSDNGLVLKGDLDLGGGFNRVRAASAASITGGTGPAADVIELREGTSGAVDLGGGEGHNTLKAGGEIGARVRSAGTGIDKISIGGGVGNVDLGTGANSLTVSAGNWCGDYAGEAGADTITIASGAQAGGVAPGGGGQRRCYSAGPFPTGTPSPATWNLGGGDNKIVATGAVNANITLGAGDDTVTVTQLPFGEGEGPGLAGGASSSGGTLSSKPESLATDPLSIERKLRPSFAALPALLSGSVILGDGNNTLVAERGIPRITGGKDKDTITLFNASGSGSISLGNGANTLVIRADVSETWSGWYGTCSLSGSGGAAVCSSGGADEDIIMIGSGVEATGPLHLGDGGNRLSGAGAASGTITMGKDGDLVGIDPAGPDGILLSTDDNPDAEKDNPDADELVRVNSLALGDLILGEGANRVWALRAKTIRGGAGADQVFLSGGAGGRINLGAGDNTLRGAGIISGAVSFLGGDDSVGDLESDSLLENGFILEGAVWLGDGANSVSAITAEAITGGAGSDRIRLSGSAMGDIDLGGGDGDNSLEVEGDLLGDVTGGTNTGKDTVAIAGGSGSVNLENGENSLAFDSATAAVWSGGYGNCSGAGLDLACPGGGSGKDSVSIGPEITVSGILSLGGGDNVVTGSGKAPGRIVMTTGDDTVGIDPAGPDGDISRADDNPSAAELAAANSLSLGTVDLGSGANRMWARDVSSLSGGGGNDTVVLAPAESFSLSTLNLGDGENKLLISGAAGDPSGRTATLNLSGGAPGHTTDSLYICSQGASSDGTCMEHEGGDHAFSAVLDASGASGSTWESVHVVNGASSVKSDLTVKGSVLLSSPKFGNIRVSGDLATTGDEITVTGAYEMVRPATAGAGAGDGGTIFELGFSTHGTPGADKLVFDAGARAPASGNPFTSPVIRLSAKAPGGAAAPSSARVDILEAHSGSGIDGVTIVGLESGRILENDTLWILRAAEASGVTTYSLEFVSAQARAEGEGTIQVAGTATQNWELKTMVNDLTVQGSGTWSGSLTGPSAGDPSSVIVISNGVTVNGSWTDLTRGAITIKGSGTLTNSFTLGDGDDTIGNFAARAPSSDNGLRLTGTVDLGGGDNRIKAEFARSLESGDGNDTVALSGSIIDKADLGGGINTVQALNAKDISGGEGRDTIELGGNATGLIDLGGGAGDNSLAVRGSLSGSVANGSATGVDRVLISQGTGGVDLGDGENHLVIEYPSGGSTGPGVPTWSGGYGVCAVSGDELACSSGGAGADMVTIKPLRETDSNGVETSKSTIVSGALHLGEGDNWIRGSGELWATVTMGSGNDAIGVDPAGDTPPSEDMIRDSNEMILGTVVLGGGSNKVWAKRVRSGGSITGGDQDDFISLSDNAQGTINLGGGEGENTLVVTNKLDANVVSRSTGKDRVEIGGGAGEVDLGGGENELLLRGQWEGVYKGGAEADSITVIFGGSGSKADISWDLGDGDNLILGSGTVKANIVLGGGEDTIGNFAFGAPARDNEIALEGAVTLGGGKNRLKAASAMAITGGAAMDTIEIEGDAGGDIDLGGGAGSNSVTINGSLGGDVRGGTETGEDLVSIGGVTGSRNVNLGNGDNWLLITGSSSVSLTYGACDAALNTCAGGSGADSISVGSATVLEALDLGDGDNTLTGDGQIRGAVGFGSGNDTIGNFADGAPDSDNQLALRGAVTLGAGENKVRAASAVAITGGEGMDTIEISGDARGDIDLGGGAGSNSVTVGSALGGDVRGGTDTGEDRVSIGGVTGSRNVNLGNGENWLTFTGDLSVSLSYGVCASAGASCSGGGSGPDTIAVGMATVAGPLHLGGGSNTLTGEGEISGAVDFGAGNDTIGNFADGAPGSDNSLSFGGAVNLGDGENKVMASSATSLTAGADNDTVILKPTAAFSLETLNLGAGTNLLALLGATGSPAGRGATVSLTTGPASGADSDSLYLCNEGWDLAASGCASGAASGAGYAFNVALDIGGDSGSTWESVHVANEWSAEQSVLSVKGRSGASDTLELPSPKFNNILVKGDGVAGDTIKISGTYEIRNPSGQGESGTVFEVDVDLRSLSSDILEFEAGSASALGADFSSTPAIKISRLDAGLAVLNEDSEIALVRAPASNSGISGITLLQVSAGSFNASDWKVADSPRVVGDIQTFFIQYTGEAVDDVVEDINPASQIGDLVLSSTHRRLRILAGQLTAKVTGFDNKDAVAEITLERGATASGDWRFPDGQTTIKGEGEISGRIDFGPGDDTIGNFAPDAPLSDNQMVLSGAVDLKDGTNRVKALSSAAITAGDGEDTIELAGNANGKINVGGGATNNSVTVGGAIDAGSESFAIESAATGIDTVSIGGGSGDVNLGGGENRFTVASGSWSGSYTGGDGIDRVISEGGAITGAVDLKGGTNELRALSSAAVTAGDGQDTINITENASGKISLGGGATNNSVTVGGTIGAGIESAATGLDTVSIGGGSGRVDLGGGENRFTVSGRWSGSYVGGSGDDTITLMAGETLSPSSIDPGDGGEDTMNVVGAPRVTSNWVTVSLSDPSPSQSPVTGSGSLYICAELSSAGACQGNSRNSAYKVVLDASQVGSRGTPWGSIYIENNQDADIQSELMVKGEVTIKNSTLGNLKISSDGQAGDMLTVSGEHGITGKTVFEIDLDTASKKADVLVFSSNAPAVFTGIPTIRVLAKGTGAIKGSEIEILKFDPDSPILARQFNIVSGSGGTGISINGQSWEVTPGAGESSSLVLKALTDIPGVPPQAAGRHVLWAAGGFTRPSARIAQLRTQSRDLQDRFQGPSLDNSSYVLTSLTSGSGSEQASETDKTEYQHSFQFINSVAELYVQETRGRRATHSLTLQYGTVKSGESLQSSVAGLGYALHVASADGSYFSAAASTSQIASEFSARGRSEEIGLSGFSLAAEAGQNTRLGPALNLVATARVDMTSLGDVKMSGGNSLIGLERSVGEIGAQLRYGGAEREGQFRPTAVSSASFYGGAAVSRDLSAGFEVKGSDSTVPVDFAKTWIDFNAGMSWASGSGRFYTEFSSASATGGVSAARTLFTLGYDISW